MPGHTTQAGQTAQADDQDAFLIQRARAGDTGCFGELVRRYEKTVYSLVSRMVPSKDEADDLVQDVFVSAWSGLSRFRGDCLFSTWLHSIAVNATLKRIKWLKRRQWISISDEESGMDNHLAGGEDEGPFEQATSAMERAAVRKSLEVLSDSHRMVVVLYYFEGYSCDEIARVMGCSVGTVWSRLHYACRKLKVQLAGFQRSGEASPEPQVFP